ncbi:homeobox-containing protein, putative [Entamoeba dispar SAW760]|uniref:Homeobox-containing protein, putative n=1 Tax=Entamoeba dispar (strain ATCC PRA-260 / SAW760) TaxID=370354 RepID=B0E9X8_ENTDS|nr:homeobox-containing protein, putative [Entamoeba dispar SAW760]EDR28663.1 homeobox-containing protein, putative [Entamoeba dispar SAW760]|eukprot:EDR28663.1 homeobox-containing protein, putative [Entamoeba dispar SAW760]
MASQKVDIFAGLEYNSSRAQKKQTINVSQHSQPIQNNQFSNTDILFQTQPKTTTPSSDDIFNLLNAPTKKSPSPSSQSFDFIQQPSSSNNTQTKSPSSFDFDKQILTPSKSPSSSVVFDFLTNTSPSNSPSFSSSQKKSSTTSTVDSNDIFSGLSYSAPKKQHNSNSQPLTNTHPTPSNTSTLSNSTTPINGNLFETPSPTTSNDLFDVLLKSPSSKSPAHAPETVDELFSSSNLNSNTHNQYSEPITQPVTQEEKKDSGNSNIIDFFGSSQPTPSTQQEKKGDFLDNLIGGEKKEEEEDTSKIVYGKQEKLTVDMVNEWACEKGTNQRKNIRSLLKNLDEILWNDQKWRKLGMSDLCDFEGVQKWYKKAVILIHPDKNQFRSADQLECAQVLFDHVRMSYNIFRKTERK